MCFAGSVSDEIPPTRWARSAKAVSTYAERMAELLDAGEDLEGEARLADVLVPRGARILDAGSGIGRVGIALQRRGHDVLAVDPDAELTAESRRRWPELTVLDLDILALDPDVHGRFDLVVAVGNVMVLLADGTERRVLGRFRDLLKPGGRILTGFRHDRAPGVGSRTYPWAEFAADVAASGLAVQHRFGGYALEPIDDHDDGEYSVTVLTSGMP